MRVRANLDDDPAVFLRVVLLDLLHREHLAARLGRRRLGRLGLGRLCRLGSVGAAHALLLEPG